MKYMDSYNRVANFGDVLKIAEEVVIGSQTNYFLNFNLKIEFDISITRVPQLPGFTKKAEEWQSVKRPDNLHFSHGEYIGEKGVNHVIEELKNKKDSNRAVISLISQQHIINSGDNPIPSFMVMQFSLEQREIYVTTYFRALEVYNFLPINLEEIRLILKRINQEITDIDSVKLNIVAFRAYANPEQTALSRFELDILSSAKILHYMESSPEEIVRLLRDKLDESTVTEKKGFVNILEIIKDNDFKTKIHTCFNNPLLKSNLETCIEKTNELSMLRAKTSHNAYIKELNKNIKDNLETVIKELEKCL
jgi:hypothetical protein